LAGGFRSVAFCQVSSRTGAACSSNCRSKASVAACSRAGLKAGFIAFTPPLAAPMAECPKIRGSGSCPQHTCRRQLLRKCGYCRHKDRLGIRNPRDPHIHAIISWPDLVVAFKRRDQKGVRTPTLKDDQPLTNNAGAPAPVGTAPCRRSRKRSNRRATA
jgi:hypothetical protein